MQWKLLIQLGGGLSSDSIEIILRDGQGQKQKKSKYRDKFINTPSHFAGFKPEPAMELTDWQWSRFSLFPR